MGAIKVWLADWSKQRLIRRPIYLAILFAVIGAGLIEARRGPWLAPEWHVEVAASVVDGIGGAILGAVLVPWLGLVRPWLPRSGTGKAKGQDDEGKLRRLRKRKDHSRRSCPLTKRSQATVRRGKHRRSKGLSALCGNGHMNGKHN